LQDSCVDYVLVKPGRLLQAYLPMQHSRIVAHNLS
jgi:hypothetical protein